jgi:co-chaperonin GroES (HSP10)
LPNVPNFTRDPDQLTRLKPLGDRLVVWLDPGEQLTPSGLIIPPAAQQITHHGTVLKIGPDVTHIPVGSTVIVDETKGVPLGVKGNMPGILYHAADIFALVFTDGENQNKDNVSAAGAESS